MNLKPMRCKLDVASKGSRLSKIRNMCYTRVWELVIQQTLLSVDSRIRNAVRQEIK